MKKYFLITMVFVLFTSLIVGCSDEKQKAQEEQKTKIVIGLDDNFPPMGFRDEKQNIIGFDIDLAKEAAKRLKTEVEFKAIDWASKEAELQSGRVDALWNGLDIIDSRKKNMDFTKPYMKDQQVIFVVEGREDIKSEKDLQGKIVGTQSGGGVAEEYLETHQELEIKEIKKYPDYISAFMDLENGRLAAVVGDEIIGRYYMQKNPLKITVVEKPLGTVSHFGVGIRKGEKKLLENIQKALDEMKKDGTLANISHKWFGKDLTDIKEN